ncbi:MAG: hypothetical protein PHR96_00575 [Clostridia bacterium]|nr:hypothetical protein [Clostridia bacterium]
MEKEINEPNVNLKQTFRTCVFVGENKIGNNCSLHKSYFENCTLADNVEVINSVLKNSIIESDSKIGPFSHIRDNSNIGQDCRIGNFVEVKNSNIKSGSKIAHLSYVGDADIGADCNIGCGVIFCNYNGIEKFRTTLGDKVFIGSNCNLIAPLVIEDEVYVASGTTLTNDLKRGETCIGRSKQEVKPFNNPYLENFKITTKYFGTDGIRGVYGEYITPELVKKVAKSLCVNKKPSVMLGTDTRPSGQTLAFAFIEEILNYGGKVYNLGIVPTACVAFYTRLYKCDYGAVITASHNPKEYNGIKILNSDGIKLSEKQEFNLENLFECKVNIKSGGKLIDLSKKREEYLSLIKNFNDTTLKGLKIVLDCSNGASSEIAPEIFKSLNADVLAVSTHGEINENCGCLHPENIIKLVLKNKADLGFAFDGDADRIIAVNSEGEILDGDDILYILTWYFKKHKLLESNKVVGTIITNKGIENKIKDLGVSLIRTQVGDKYIIEKMLQYDFELGGEQTGHIIFNNLIPSGDGVLTARILAHIYLENKSIFKSVKSNKYIQIQREVKLKNSAQKNLLMDKSFKNLIEFYKSKLGDGGKIIVRPSGTEPVIRILVETTDKNTALVYAMELKKKITKLINKAEN